MDILKHFSEGADITANLDQMQMDNRNTIQYNSTANFLVLRMPWLNFLRL